MKWIASFVAFSLAVAGATEIIGWKAPIANLTSEGLGAPGIVRLGNPPEKSPFFGAADVLWNIRSVLPQEAAAAQWAVWNASTGRIVVKGPWGAIREMEESLNMTSQCRITVDAFRIAEDGSPPDFTKAPDATTSVVAGNGQKASVSEAGENSAITLLVEPLTEPGTGLIDLRLVISASLPDTPDLEINTAVSIIAPGDLWVARDFDGKSGTDIRVSAAIELPDGTPYGEMMLRQEGDAVVPFLVDRSGAKRIAIEGGGWLASAWLDYKSASDLLAGGKADEEDPFAETETKPKVLLDELPTAQTPEKLGPYFGGEVTDLRETLRKMGIILGENDFAGYDSRIERVFMYSENEAEIDKFEQLFETFSSGIPEMVAFSSRGSGEMRLLARGGQKATLKSSRADTKQKRDLEIEPHVGANHTLVDLRIFYEEKHGEKLMRGLNSSFRLVPGESLEILKSKVPGGDESKLEIKAEILEHP
jgi:hypothetical protein